MNAHSPETIAAMREWIADCCWPDLDPEEVPQLSEAEIVNGVRRHFDGGVKAFLQTMEVSA